MAVYLPTLLILSWRSDRLVLWTWRRMLQRTRLEWGTDHA